MSKKSMSRAGRKNALFSFLFLILFVCSFGGKAEAEEYIAVDSTTFPDEVFRNYVLNKFDSNKDELLSPAEIKNAKTIDLQNTGVSSLQGIKCFTALHTLDCTYNYLISLDVSDCASLTELRCSNNQLSSLNISGCLALSKVDCSNNQLANLNTSECRALTELSCGGNQLKSLNVSGCSSLISLYCYGNQLTSLSVMDCQILTRLYCYNNQLTELNISNSQNLLLAYLYGTYVDEGNFHSWYYDQTGTVYRLRCDKSVTIQGNISTKYTVSFVDYDGFVLQTGQYSTGETPVYTGELPTRADEPFHIYSFAGWSPEIKPVTGDITYTAQYDDLVYARVESNALELEGKLGIYFNVSAPDEARFAVISFNKDGGLDEATFELDRNSAIYNEATGRFRIPYRNVALKEMTIPATIRFYSADKKQLGVAYKDTGLCENNEYSYTVADWCNTAISQSSNDNTIRLAKALLNLGGAAQTYFNYNLNDPANPNSYLQDETYGVAADTAYDAVIPSNSSQVGYKSMSLNLEGDTELRLRFTKKITATRDGKKLTVVKDTDGTYYVKIPGIAGVDLNEMYTIKVTYSGTTATFKFAALSYANAAIGKGGAAIKHLSKALYLYNRSARVYFGKPVTYHVGDIITLGYYGGEAVEWQVLTIDGPKLLVISKYGLDSQPYNTIYTDVTWETCTLRNWLNNDFYNSTFSEAEKGKIRETEVKNDDNPYYGTPGGNDTTDKVFLLSIAEAMTYFESDEARECLPTQYAVSRGVWKSDYHGCYWWLRSPGIVSKRAAYVFFDGGLNEYSANVDFVSLAVRPAMWITP